MKNNNKELSGTAKIVLYIALFITGVIGCYVGFLGYLILITNLSNQIQQSESEKQKSDLSYIVEHAPTLNVISITKNSNGSTNTVFDFKNSEYDDSNKNMP